VTTHRVLYDVAGQTLRHILPEHVETVNYTIESVAEPLETAARTLASGSATVSSVSLTTDGAAGVDQSNDRRVPVSATTGAAIGDELAIIGADGQFEAFTVDGLVSADYLTADAPLAGTYASGSLVKGLRATVSVPAALYDDETLLLQERPLRIVWQYTTAAGVRRVTEPIQLERNSESDFGLGDALANLRKGYGSALQRLPDGQNLNSIAEYCVGDLRTRLAVRGEQTQRWALGDTGRRLLELRILAHLGELGSTPGSVEPRVWAAESAKRFDDAFAALVVGEAGTDPIKTDVRDQANSGPDRTYRGPVLAP